MVTRECDYCLHIRTIITIRRKCEGGSDDGDGDDGGDGDDDDGDDDDDGGDDVGYGVGGGASVRRQR